jgi:hypothetical protein
MRTAGRIFLENGIWKLKHTFSAVLLSRVSNSFSSKFTAELRAFIGLS